MDWIVWDNDDQSDLMRRPCSASSKSSSYLSVHYSSILRNNFKRRMQKLRICNLQLSTEIEIKSWHQSGAVHCMSLEKQDYRYLLCGGADGFVSLYDLESTSNTNKDGRALPQSISSMATGLAADSFNGRNDNSNNLAGAVASVQWYPTDTGVFTTASRKGQVQLWDTNEFSIVTSFNMNDGESIRCSSMNSCDHRSKPLIAVGATSNKIFLCDPMTGDKSHTLLGHKDYISALSWSPLNPFQLASASDDGSLKLWDVRKANSQGLLHSFDWRQDHMTITTDRFPLQHAFNSMSKKKLSVKQDDASLRRLKDVDWSKNSLTQAHESEIMSIQYSSCGRYLVSSGNDKKVRLWNTSDGTLEATNFAVGNKSELAYSMCIASFGHPADDLLISPAGAFGNIAIIPLHSSIGKPIKILRGHIEMVNAVVFREPRQQIISCSRDGLIFLWDCPSSDQTSSSICFEDYKIRSRNGNYASNSFHGHNDDDKDSWSDDELIPVRETEIRRHFIPPIIQNYIDDATS